MGCRTGAILVRLLAVLGVIAVWTGLSAPGAYGAGGTARAADGAAGGAAAQAGPPNGWAKQRTRERNGEEILFHFTDPRITESSGLAVSPTHKGIYYTHNDSSDEPRFFAVGADGRTRATFTLANATARDWEGMAASVDRATGKGVLWFADIGDNLNGAWPDISVYKVIEPERMADATLRAVRYRFRYEDGPRNAEGIMVHPGTGRLYVVSKEFSGSIYAAPTKLRTDRVNILRRVGPAPIMATDAAYSPDGSSFVIGERCSVSLTAFDGAGDGGGASALVDLIEGILRLALSPQPAWNGLEVRTATAIAAVRSTEWIVESAPEGTAVFVVEGAVSVSGRAGGEVLLQPGYGTDVPPGGAPGEPKRWGAARVESALARTRLP